MRNGNKAAENKSSDTSKTVKIETKAEPVSVKTGAALEVMPALKPKRVALSENGLPSSDDLTNYLRTCHLDKHGEK